MSRSHSPSSSSISMVMSESIRESQSIHDHQPLTTLTQTQSEADHHQTVGKTEKKTTQQTDAACAIPSHTHTHATTYGYEYSTPDPIGTAPAQYQDSHPHSHSHSHSHATAPVSLPPTYSPFPSSSRPGAIATVLVIGILFFLFLIAAISALAWLMIVSQIILGAVATLVMFIWLYTHRTGDAAATSSSHHHHDNNQSQPLLNDRTSTSALVSRFGLGCIVGVLFTALMIGESSILVFVTVSSVRHRRGQNITPSDLNEQLIGPLWADLTIILIIQAIQFWVFMWIITSATAKIRTGNGTLLGTRAQIMNSMSLTLGASTGFLYVAFTLLAMDVQNFNSYTDDWVNETAVLLPTFICAIVILPLDVICSEYMSIRMALRHLVPSVYGDQKCYHALAAPIIVRVLVLVFGSGMLILQLTRGPWSTTVPVFLAISWLVFILPFAYVTRGWRRVWAAEVAALRPVELSSVQVLEALVPRQH